MSAPGAHGGGGNIVWVTKGYDALEFDHDDVYIARDANGLILSVALTDSEDAAREIIERSKCSLREYRRRFGKGATWVFEWPEAASAS